MERAPIFVDVLLDGHRDARFWPLCFLLKARWCTEAGHRDFEKEALTRSPLMPTEEFTVCDDNVDLKRAESASRVGDQPEGPRTTDTDGQAALPVNQVTGGGAYYCLGHEGIWNGCLLTAAGSMVGPLNWILSVMGTQIPPCCLAPKTRFHVAGGE